MAELDVVDLEADKVVLQVTGRPGDDVVLWQAQKARQVHGKGAHGPISEFCASDYCIRRHVLYACAGKLLQP